jgi:hypothetical protein
MKENKILIFVEEEQITRGNSIAKKVTKSIDVATLAAQVHDFEKKLITVFEKREEASDSAFHLNEISINAEINAEGEIGILGTGVKLGGKAGITLTFTRNTK